MDLPESANIRDLDPDDLRSADTVHPGSPKLPNSAEQSYLDDGVEDAIPFDVPTDSPPVDPLQETDASYGFEPQEPAEMPTPLPHKAVQRLVEQNGDMSPPIGSQPISADNGDLTPPLSDEIEPTRWVSQDELVNVNGVMTNGAGDYSPPIETAPFTPGGETQDYFGPLSSDHTDPDNHTDPFVDSNGDPSTAELIEGLENSQELERDARELDTSYPTSDELSSRDDAEVSTDLVSAITPPLSPEPDSVNLYSDEGRSPGSPERSVDSYSSDDEDIQVNVLSSPDRSSSGGTSYFVHVSDDGKTSTTALTSTSERDGRVSYSPIDTV